MSCDLGRLCRLDVATVKGGRARTGTTCALALLFKVDLEASLVGLIQSRIPVRVEYEEKCILLSRELSFNFPAS